MAETCQGCEFLLVSWPQTDLLWLENDPSANHSSQLPARYPQPQTHHICEWPTQGRV